jgi:hypothetical protein
VPRVRNGEKPLKHQTTQSNGSDHDLLTEIQARDQELPMSLAWFHRKRLFGGGPPFIRVSNRVFYRRGELREWIAEHAVGRSGEVRS